MILLKIEQMKINFENDCRIFHYPDIFLEENKCICLTGKSGSGKTTLLNALLKPSFSGRVNYKSALILNNDLKSNIKTKFEHISYMPQYSQNALNPSLKIIDQIKLVKKSNRDTLEDFKIIEYIEELGMASKILDMYPYELSGGMKQRTSLLLGYIKKPKLYFIDEASSAIDYVTQENLINFILKRKNEGTSVLCVSHHKGMINRMADEIVEIKENSNG